MGRTIAYYDGRDHKADLSIYGRVGDFTIENPGELSTDIYGLDTVTTVWKGACDLSPITTYPMFMAHPLYPWTNMERRRIQIDKGYYIVTGDFAGVNGRSASIFELTVGVQDEPIQAHPKFVSSIGGKPSAPLNGAVFLGPDGQPTTDDSVGQFAYFNLSTANAGTSSFAGVESYLSADCVTWRERYVTDILVFYNDIGYLSAPSGGPPVQAVNWIKISSNIERRGNCFFVTNEWRAGGRNGWNTLIYTR